MTRAEATKCLVEGWYLGKKATAEDEKLAAAILGNYPGCALLPRQLQLGDTIQLFDTGPFGDAVVYRIKDGVVTALRLYGTTADFSTGDSAIPYIGIEEVLLLLSENRRYKVWHRKELR